MQESYHQTGSTDNPNGELAEVKEAMVTYYQRKGDGKITEFMHPFGVGIEHT